MSSYKFHLVHAGRVALMILTAVGLGLGAAWCDSFAPLWARNTLTIMSAVGAILLSLGAVRFVAYWMAETSKRHSNFNMGWEAENFIRKLIADELKKSREVAR